MTSQDHEHLKVLSILNYVMAALRAVGGIFPLIYIAIGFFMVANPEALQGNQGQTPPPPWLGWVLIGIGGCLTVFLVGLAVATFLNGRYLAQRRHYVFCFVVSCLQCLQMPLGTALGVCTILVLLRESVKQQFRERSVQ